MKKIISIFIISIFSSCGFYSFTGASISPEVKTFSVNYFPNKSNSINPALSSVFTEMLKEHFSTLGFCEGNKKTQGTFVQERAFVG